MMECKSATERLGAWLDDELHGAEADAVRAHIESCRECAEECRQMRRLQSAIQNVLAAEAAKLAFQPFWRGVEQKVAEKKGPFASVTEFIHAAFGAPRLVWAIPVAIVALLGVLSVDWITPPWSAPAQRNNFASVESIDSHGRNVAVFRENESKTTVIWLYQNPEGEDEPSSEVPGSSPTF